MSDINVIDIGANLTHDSFSEDLDNVLERARAAGVMRFIITGSSATGSRDAVDLAAQYPNLMRATAGVHPHHASEYNDTVETTLLELLAQDTVVAVGECGLDYFRNFSPRQAQLEAFERQLTLAENVGKPLFLHQRDAHEDFVAVLSERIDTLPHGVAHCFTGDEAMLRRYLDMGLYIGITGWICDERRGAHLRDLVPQIPPDRLMIETDAPYLLPRTLDPKPASRRNEPMYLPEVLRVVAESAGVTAEEMAHRTTATATQFFGL